MCDTVTLHTICILKIVMFNISIRFIYLLFSLSLLALCLWLYFFFLLLFLFFLIDQKIRSFRLRSIYGTNKNCQTIMLIDLQALSIEHYFWTENFVTHLSRIILHIQFFSFQFCYISTLSLSLSISSFLVLLFLCVHSTFACGCCQSL